MSAGEAARPRNPNRNLLELWLSTPNYNNTKLKIKVKTAIRARRYETKGNQMSETVVSLKNIDKHYWLRVAKQSLIGSFIALFKKKSISREQKEVRALKGIELSIKKGEALGIIGENASGKTTLLRIISKITMPTCGQLTVKGKVAGLLDLGAGFHSELTGKENIYLDAALYGLSRNEIDAVYDKIVDFSGLGDFIQAQIKTYSQGMLVRLGFAIAIHVNPDIFLIDDSLAVGDEEFQRKCLSKIFELKKQGKTIIVVSHDLDSISRICERGVLLQSGRIIKDDSMHKVIMRYVLAVGDKHSIASIDKGKLGVIFNAGKIVLLWDGEPLTKNFGGYASLQFIDQWVMSWKAKWEVIKSDNCCWKAQGILSSQGIELLLECSIKNESSIDFNLQIRTNLKVSIKKTAFAFMFSEKYEQFFMNDHFEKIEANQKASAQWTDVYRTDENSAPLIMKSNVLPAIKMHFNQNCLPCFSLIQNTAQNLDARVVQMQTIAVKQDDLALKTISYNLKFDLLDQQQLDDFVSFRKQSNSIIQGDTEVQLSDKQIKLFFNNRQLTKNNNLRFGFYCERAYFDIFDGQWRASKISEKKIIISSFFKQFNAELDLALCLENNKLNWSLKIDDQHLIKKSIMVFQADFNDSFNEYFDIEKHYNFLSSCEHAETLLPNLSASRLLGLAQSRADFVWAIFEFDDNSIIELRNENFQNKSRQILSKALENNISKGSVSLFDNQKLKDDFMAVKQSQAECNFMLFGQFRIEFQQNIIKLYKDDLLLTAGEGFCSGVFFNQRWHESGQLKKRFERQGNQLKVFIDRQLPKITEIWSLSFEQSAIVWNIKIKFDAPMPELVSKAGILLKNEFKTWTNIFKTEDFIDDNSVHVVDLDDKNTKLLGTKPNSRNFPAVFFEIKQVLDCRGIIINSLDGRRALLFKFQSGETINLSSPKQVFNGKIRFFENSDWEKQIKQYNNQHFTLVGRNDLKFIFSPNRISLDWKDLRLFGKDGLRAAVYTDLGDFDSSEGNWQFKKISPYKIQVLISWPGQVCRGKWEFELKDQSIVWQAALGTKQRVLIKNININLFAQSWFDKWFSFKQQGNIEFKDQATDSIALFDNRSDFIGIYRRQICPVNPAIVLRSLVDMEKWFLHIYKYRKDDVIACGANRIIKPEGKYFAIGEHQIFNGEICLVDNEQSINILKENCIEPKSIIKSGRIALEIGRAKVRLFWQDQELTNLLGLHTAFFNKKKWVDSSLAAWHADVKDKKATVSLNWADFSAQQKWQLSLVNENEILWDIDTDLKNREIDIFSAKLMLNPNYSHYLAEGKKETEFPAEFESGRWQELVSGDKPVSVISKQALLPDIFFDGKVLKADSNNIIENSDLLHSARVLKCETKKMNHDSTKTLSFSSQIKISLRQNDGIN